MATPARNLVLEHIAAVLGNISTATGYRTNPATVEREIREWETVGKNEFPYIGFKPGRTRYEHQPGGYVRAVMPLDIVIHVNTATAALRSDLLSNMEDDIWEALTAGKLNSGSGGTDLSTMVRILEFETDEGDPDTMDSRGGTGSGHIVAEVIYHRTTGESV